MEPINADAPDSQIAQRRPVLLLSLNSTMIFSYANVFAQESCNDESDNLQYKLKLANTKYL